LNPSKSPGLILSGQPTPLRPPFTPHPTSPVQLPHQPKPKRLNSTRPQRRFPLSELNLISPLTRPQHDPIIQSDASLPRRNPCSPNHTPTLTEPANIDTNRLHIYSEEASSHVLMPLAYKYRPWDPSPLISPIRAQPMDFTPRSSLCQLRRLQARPTQHRSSPSTAASVGSSAEAGGPSCRALDITKYLETFLHVDDRLYRSTLSKESTVSFSMSRSACRARPYRGWCNIVRDQASSGELRTMSINRDDCLTMAPTVVVTHRDTPWQFDLE
jgi:hypothetical protein